MIRPLATATLTLGLCLAASAGLGHAVRSAVLGRLREVDPGATASRISAAPGVILLEDLRLPSLGLRLDRVTAWWSLGFLSPAVDSLVVSDGCWTPDSTRRSGGGRSNAGSPMPSIRFSGVSILRGGADIATVSGSLHRGGEGGGSFKALGGWGLAQGSFRLLEGPDSLVADWFRLSGEIPGLPRLPEPLRGHTLEGSLSAEVGEGSIVLDGALSRLDGQSVEAGFRVRSDADGSDFSALLDLADFRGVLEESVDSLLRNGSFSLSPRGTLEIGFRGADSLLLRADAEFDSIRLFHPALSEDTVVVFLSLRFEGTYLPGSGEVRVDSGEIGVGPARFGFTLDGRLSYPPRLALRIWNPSLSGEDISAALPAGLLGDLEGLRLGGEASVDMAVVLDWAIPDSSDFSADVDVSRLSVLECPIGISVYRSGGSCRMRDSWGNSRTLFLSPGENGSFVRYDRLHPCLEGILKCAEDGSFRSHTGFSELQIRNAIRDNMASGAFVRGASTLTMQLARNLMLDRERNLARKLQEVFLTWRLEETLGKDRILEIYCNIVELGPDVFGFQEAALYYFDADLEALTSREVAFLVSILPGPSLYHRFFREGAVPGTWNDYLDRLMTLAGQRGWIPPDSVSAGLAGSVVFRGG